CFSAGKGGRRAKGTLRGSKIIRAARLQRLWKDLLAATRHARVFECPLLSGGNLAPIGFPESCFSPRGVQRPFCSRLVAQSAGGQNQVGDFPARNCPQCSATRELLCGARSSVWPSGSTLVGHARSHALRRNPRCSRRTVCSYGRFGLSDTFLRAAHRAHAAAELLSSRGFAVRWRGCSTNQSSSNEFARIPGTRRGSGPRFAGRNRENAANGAAYAVSPRRTHQDRAAVHRFSIGLARRERTVGRRKDE